MPAFLQDKCIFSLLGYYDTDSGANGQFPRNGNDRDKLIFSSSNKQKSTCSQNIHEGNRGRWSCGCHKFDGLLEQLRIASLEHNPWVKLVYGFSETVNRKIELIPKLDHVHWEKETSQLNLHVCRSCSPMLHAFPSSSPAPYVLCYLLTCLTTKFR